MQTNISNFIIKDYFAYRNRYKTNPLFNINFWSVIVYRLSSLFNNKLKIVAKLLWLINRILFGIDIDHGFKINGSFMIIHGNGIVIGKSVFCNGNLIVYQNVTLGGNNHKTQLIKNTILIDQPYFEGGNIVGPGAVVLGPCYIGVNSTIGANTITTKNIGSNYIKK